MEEKKETYEQKIQAQLDEWKADIDRLKEKAKTASADAKVMYAESIEKLELKLSEGRSKLMDLKESSAEAWETVKKGADSIWDTMKATFAEAKEKFKDKEEGTQSM